MSRSLQLRSQRALRLTPDPKPILLQIQQPKAKPPGATREVHSHSCIYQATSLLSPIPALHPRLAVTASEIAQAKDPPPRPWKVGSPKT